MVAEKSSPETLIGTGIRFDAVQLASGTGVGPQSKRRSVTAFFCAFVLFIFGCVFVVVCFVNCERYKLLGAIRG